MEIYGVDGSAGVSAWEARTVPVVYGDPGVDLARTGLMATSLGAVPTVLAGDAGPDFDESARVVSDGWLAAS